MAGWLDSEVGFEFLSENSIRKTGNIYILYFQLYDVQHKSFLEIKCFNFLDLIKKIAIYICLLFDL